MTAKSFGYGSVSKLATIAAARPGDERHFVGSGIALEFATRNRDHFSTVDECEIEAGWPLVAWLRGPDALVSVRNADAVFWARRAGLPALFVDSLLWFWKPQREIEDLVDLARALDALPAEAAWSSFCALSEHDRAVMGHVLADASLAQRFPGVDERVNRLSNAGCTGVRACGPIVDYDMIRSLAEDMVAASAPAATDWDVVINVCGYDNFVLDSKTTPAYLRLLERWTCDYVRRHSNCRRALICGGPYRSGGVTEVGSSVVELGTLTHADLLRVAARAPRYLCSPGLTSFHELVALGRVPRMGPPQHSCHLASIRALEAQGLDRIGLDLSPIVGDDVPADDLGGTMAIIDQSKQVLDDPRAYRAVADRLDTLLDLSASDVNQVDSTEMHRLHQMLSGPDAQESISAALCAAAPAGKGLE